MPGQRFKVRPADMPVPTATPSVGNSPRRVGRPWATPLRVPEGFTVTLFADGLAVGGDGSLLIADDTSNAVWRVGYTGGD